MSESKKIANNTIFLYIRMVINMAISLYTSRVILKVLGIEDFGIYNLVGGVVVLFSFLNNAMTNATQRFLNIEIATKVIDNIRRVFCMSLNIHVIISICVLILSETIGMWFLNYKLNIPRDRIFAANIVYQLSILTTIVNIIRIPYNAMIIANEKMSFYAFLGIFETVMKLVIVFLLFFFTGKDHLIVYSILLLIVSILVNKIYYIYNAKKFRRETAYFYFKDKRLFRELISFSGWSLFGQVAVLGSTQGINMILNIFIGVTVNAALGIANQVNGVIYNFISNLQVAFNPQIIKTYAERNLERHRSLVLNTSKYSMYLFLFLALPFLINTEFILTLWLGHNLPTYVVSFTQIVIIGSIINAMAGPFWMSANAVGNIRNYQLGISLILLLNLPFAYVLLKSGYSAVFVLGSQVLLNTLTFLFRFWYIYGKLNFQKKEIFSYSKSIFFVLFYIGVLFYFYNNNNNSKILQIIFSSIIVEIGLACVVIVLGINKNEFLMVKGFIKNKLNKNKNDKR